MRNGEKASGLKGNGSAYLAKRNIRLFGSTETMFSDTVLFNSELEKLSLAVHLVYWGALDKPHDSDAYKSACRDFETNEYNRRSSMATALHILYKLRGCGILAADESQLTNEKADAFEKLLSQDGGEMLEALAQSEHLRWNAFLRSEGYRGASVETMKQYAVKVKNQKESIARLHPCITDWDNLDRVSAEYNALMHTNKDFKEYDREIVRAIPQIIRAVNDKRV